jgi:hypothetical protein
MKSPRGLSCGGTYEADRKFQSRQRQIIRSEMTEVSSETSNSYDTSGCHGGEYEDDSFLRCSAV